MTLTQETMDDLARRYFLPIMLLLDYAMCHYLVSVYFARRRELRVLQLFFGSFLGFTTLITFADTSKEDLQALNDASETCSQLVFLVQITIIGYAVQTKVRLRSIRWFTLAAEILIIADWINLAMNFVELFGYNLGDAFHVYNNFLESFTLTFVLVFRFFYLSMSKGLMAVLRERRLEFFAYVLVVTHEYVFMIFEHATGVSWEYVQGIYMRTMIASCLVLNVAHKKGALKSSSAHAAANRTTTVAPDSEGPKTKFGPGPALNSLGTNVEGVRKATMVKPLDKASAQSSKLSNDGLPDGDF